MLPQPSISTLFHDLFDSEWARDDPEFLAEVEKYGTVLRRMLNVDSQLSSYIQSQPILDYDQISTAPVIINHRKVQIVAHCVPKSGSQLLFQFSSSPVNITDVFVAIRVRPRTDGPADLRYFEYGPGNEPCSSVTAEFDSRCSSVEVFAQWKFPAARYSDALTKFMGQAVAFPGEIIQKILAHIDNRNLCVDGVVKCDNTLKNILELESFKLADLGEIVGSKIHRLEPLHFTMNAPGSYGAHVTIPEIPFQMKDFEPLKVNPPPIRQFLETALESKEHLLAFENFEMNPEEFVDEMVREKAQAQDMDDVIDSTYFFQQPWVLNAASGVIKKYEYARKKETK